MDAPSRSRRGAPLAPEASAADDAVSALVALGYKPVEASRMVKAVAQEGLPSEEIIRAALKSAAPQR